MKIKNLVSRAASLTAALGLLSLLSISIAHSAHAAGSVDPDADYDRLDGTGKSGKRVDVIEWEGNLEIHVYPKGSTAGLGMKIDDANGKKVMVIAYRFKEAPAQVLTRRNILGISLSNTFKVYKDPMENEFDKFIISDNGLSGQVVAFNLDPTPTNLYPEGPAVAKSAGNTGRAPASAPQASQPGTGYRDTTQDVPPSQGVDDNGSLPSFFHDHGGGRLDNTLHYGK